MSGLGGEDELEDVVSDQEFGEPEGGGDGDQRIGQDWQSDGGGTSKLVFVFLLVVAVWVTGSVFSDNSVESLITVDGREASSVPPPPRSVVSGGGAQTVPGASRGGGSSSGGGEVVAKSPTADPVASPTSPPLTSPTRPHPPIAVCFAGQPRASESVFWRAMYDRIVRPIRDKADVFMALSNGNSFALADPGPTHVHSRNLSFAMSLMQPRKAIHYVSSELGLKTASSIHFMKWKGKQIFGWGAYQALSWHTCYGLVKEEEKRRGVPYQWVVKARTDSIFRGALPPFERWPDPSRVDNATVWVNRLGACGLSERRGLPEFKACIGDHFGVQMRGLPSDAYMDGYWYDFIENDNVTEGALATRAGSCPECMLGNCLSQRGVHKRTLTDHDEAPLMWRNLPESQWDRFSRAFEPIFGGLPDLPLMSKCDTEQCADDFCGRHRGVLDTMTPVATAFCKLFARNPVKWELVFADADSK